MIDFVIGTRPELIKLRPVALRVKALGVPVRIAFTFQHEAIADDVERLAMALSDRAMSYRFKPSGAPFTANDTRCVVVQGDTTSACGAALIAANQRIPVVHVEAGLRTVLTDDTIEHILAVEPTPTSRSFLSRSLRPVPARAPFPEEMNRQLISRVASLHLAPTYQNERNLCAEKVGGQITITGNPGITAVTDWFEQPYNKGKPYTKPTEQSILVTCHRRENWPHIKLLVEELVKVAQAQSLPIAIVKHPNRALYRGIEEPIYINGNGSRCFFLDPASHEQMLIYMLESKLVVTDSGGLIEEATWLGKRRLVLRGETERPEALAPLAKIEPGLHTKILDALDQPAPSDGSRYAFGDEKSADNCAAAIAAFYKEL